MSLLFSMLSRLVITFLPRSKCLLISWLQSPSAMIFEPQKIKSATVSPSICREVMGPDAMILVFLRHSWDTIHDWAASLSLSTFHFPLSCIGEGNGNPLQCSWLENPRDRGAWWAVVYGVAQGRTRLKRHSSSRDTIYQSMRKEGRDECSWMLTAIHVATLIRWNGMSYDSQQDMTSSLFLSENAKTRPQLS